jgi:hypothetical protein
LQSWLALLQLPLPLQSFVPSQWTPFIAFLPAKATAGAISVAKAPAIATPFNVPFFIGTLLVLRGLPCEPPQAVHAGDGRSRFIDQSN